jgi:hypothetical protein
VRGSSSAGFGDRRRAGDLAQRACIDELRRTARRPGVIQTAMACNADQPLARMIDAAKMIQALDCIHEHSLADVGRFGIIADPAPAIAKHVIAVELPQDLDGALVVAGRACVRPRSQRGLAECFGGGGCKTGQRRQSSGTRGHR